MATYTLPSGEENASKPGVGQDDHPPGHARLARHGQERAPRLVEILLERGRAHEPEGVAPVLGEVLVLAHREARWLVGARLEPGEHGRVGSLVTEQGRRPRRRLHAALSRAAGDEQERERPADPPQ